MATAAPNPDLVSAEKLIRECGCLIQRHYKQAPAQLTEAFDHLEEAQRLVYSTLSPFSIDE